MICVYKNAARLTSAVGESPNARDKHEKCLDPSRLGHKCENPNHQECDGADDDRNKSHISATKLIRGKNKKKRNEKLD